MYGGGCWGILHVPALQQEDTQSPLSVEIPEQVKKELLKPARGPEGVHRVGKWPPKCNQVLVVKLCA